MKRIRDETTGKSQGTRIRRMERIRDGNNGTEFKGNFTLHGP
jgi:hypothetical protein